MKKKPIKKFIIYIAFLIFFAWLFSTYNKEEVQNKDENTLYYEEFNNISIRVQRYDYSLGQNQIVGVEKSLDNGKTFEKITNEEIVVSMEPKIVFINDRLGFIISKSILSKANGYFGIKVTDDGGRTFTDAKIIFDDPSVEIITVEDVPYEDKNILKIPCAIYVTKEDLSGYENKSVIFKSTDNGYNWNVMNNDTNVSMNVRLDTLTNVGATFVLKNDTTINYLYGPEYHLEKFEDDIWKTVKLDTPLNWNSVAYVLTPGEEKEIIIDWSGIYGLLEANKYRLVKTVFKEDERPIDDSMKMSLYAEFDIVTEQVPEEEPQG